MLYYLVLKIMGITMTGLPSGRNISVSNILSVEKAEQHVGRFLFPMFIHILTIHGGPDNTIFLHNILETPPCKSYD